MHSTAQVEFAAVAGRLAAQGGRFIPKTLESGIVEFFEQDVAGIRGKRGYS